VTLGILSGVVVLGVVGVTIGIVDSMYCGCAPVRVLVGRWGVGWLCGSGRPLMVFPASAALRVVM